MNREGRGRSSNCQNFSSAKDTTGHCLDGFLHGGCSIPTPSAEEKHNKSWNF